MSRGCVLHDDHRLPVRCCGGFATPVAGPAVLGQGRWSLCEREDLGPCARCGITAEIRGVDALTFARLQFGTLTVYHFLFVR